ncbi:hypothetical protein NMY22_g2004 [Coprinellus aureogranulatus]|nr:hypothetical protein NMY22_g2004 [Coprinellus aureogranulatus]
MEGLYTRSGARYSIYGCTERFSLQDALENACTAELHDDDVGVIESNPGDEAEKKRKERDDGPEDSFSEGKDRGVLVHDEENNDGVGARGREERESYKKRRTTRTTRRGRRHAVGDGDNDEQESEGKNS